MSRCKIVWYAFSLGPVKIWQDFLIRVHIEKCPECQKKLISREAVQGITIREFQCGDADSLWNGFEQKVRRANENNRHVFGPFRRWVYAMAVLLLFVATAIWFVVSPPLRKARIEESLNEHFRINYIRVEDKPAQAYVYQPQDSNMIIVWAQKNFRGE
jgi:hypothetical protein